MQPSHPQGVAAHGRGRNRFGLGCVLVFSVLSALGAPVRSGDYQIGVWTSNDGLPHSSVTAIEQTPDGYLWVGTYNGLARFDGMHFVTFDPEHTPALQHARVRRLYVDKPGTLWINTYDGSLISYRDKVFTMEWKGDGSSDSTAPLIASRSNQPVFLLHTGDLIRRRLNGTGTNRWQTLRPPGASTGEIAVEDGQGAIWCRGRDQKLWRLTGDTFQEVSTNGLQGRNFNTLIADARGRVWVGTEREFAVWDGTRFQSMTPTNGEAVLNVTYLYIAKDGDAWVLANDRVRRARERQWVFEVEECRGVFTGYQDRLGIHEGNNGGAWIYHYGKGIFHVRADGRTRQLAAEEDFPGNRVDCFHEDHEGNLWAGVDRGGLVRMREKRFTVLTPDDPAVAKSAVSVAQDAKGAIWIGTFGGGLYRWFNDKWENFVLPGATRFVFSVFPDKDDRVWLSAGEEDLIVGTNGDFHVASPAVHGIKALLPARDGRLWIGTKSGLASVTAGRFRQFMPQDGVRRVDIRALVEDAKGVIWAGAGDGTLYRIETNHVTGALPKDALAAQPIWSLLADTDGTIWVGTFRGGLMRYKNGEFVRYTSKQGLPDDVICQILDDGNGCLWIGSQRGIFRVAKVDLDAFAQGSGKTINCTAYGRLDGLPSLECSGSYQPAAWHTRDGQLLFATFKGVVSVRPEDLKPNLLPPPVVIEEFLVDGELQPPVARSKSETGLGKSVIPVQEVSPGKRQVGFRFTALSFISSDRLRFEYKLDGLDEEWIEAGTRRYAQYSYLRPGDYSFHVIACNSDGVWNKLGDTMILRVLPYFYQRWWFQVFAGMAVIILVAVAVRQFAVRGMRQQLERLQRQRAVEADRTRIAKDIHDDLGAGLTHIMLLSELARRSPQPEIPEQLDHISEMARELTRAMDETVWAVNPHNDTLEGLMTYVTKFAQDYLNVAGIRCRLDLPAQLPPHTLPAELRHNLFLAVKEALNNVVKHARATEVWLSLTLQPRGFILVIADDGRGLADRTKKSDDAPSLRISSGHGLGNLEKRLAANGGRCVVTSAPGKGTRVEFTVKFSPPT